MLFSVVGLLLRSVDGDSTDQPRQKKTTPSLSESFLLEFLLHYFYFVEIRISKFQHFLSDLTPPPRTRLSGELANFLRSNLGEDQIKHLLRPESLVVDEVLNVSVREMRKNLSRIDSIIRF